MKEGPDKVYGPQLAKMMLDFCNAIYAETDATGIRISAEFLYRHPKGVRGRGDLKIKTFITPDGKTERMLDRNILMPRGTKLATEAYAKLKAVVKKVRRA